MSNAPLTLLYLTGDSSAVPGVAKKEVARIRALNCVGLKTIPVFFLSPEVRLVPPASELENIQIVPVPQPQLPFFLNRRYIRNYKARIQYSAANRLRYHAIATVLAKQFYDFAFMRYPLASRALAKLIRRCPNKLIFEHNTKETHEIRYSGADVGVSYLLQQERRYVRKILQNAAGIVAVTQDILEYELDRSGADPRKGIAISNGISPEGTAPRRIPQDHKTLRLLFVASPAEWHGLDRLFQGLARYTGSWPVELVLVGDYPAKIRELIRSLNIESRVTLTGKLAGADLTALFDHCHIAVGSLGLHRLTMSQGSTLKVGEYLMRGIPLIVAHHEMDLSQAQSISHLYLELPATEDPIDLQRVAEFARGALADSEHVTKLRTFAEAHVTMDRKALQLKQFIQQLAVARSCHSSPLP